MKLQTLYRPVGLKEFEMIAASGFRAYPPRLEWQPIFYPVMNEPYARQIAFEWNTRDAFSGYCGIVTAFKLPVAFLERYPVQTVGGDIHQELWVPAEELTSLNNAIIGFIETRAVYLGEGFVPPEAKAVADLLQNYKEHEREK
jgi:hypothetical protein